MNITSVTSTSITVNVNGGQGAVTDTSVHNFVSASTDCITAIDVSSHSYPRSTDPVSGQWLKVFNRGVNTYDVQVGNLFGQAAISNNTTHVCTNIGAAAIWHARDFVKFDENAITLSCTKDQNATNHTYPRRTDPTFGQWLPISNVTTTQFDVLSLIHI